MSNPAPPTPPPLSHASPAETNATDDDTPAAPGWDTAAHSTPPIPPRRLTPDQRRQRWAIAVIAVLILGWIAWSAYREYFPPPYNGPWPENPYVQNLKALATAQAQYIKKTDAYAASGWQLNVTGTFIARDLRDAFEAFQGNGDSPQPQPKNGHIFRMLQGNSPATPTSFHKDPSHALSGMNTWAAISRPVHDGSSDAYGGENQYLITESGYVYKHVDPQPGEPGYNQFVLDICPTWEQLVDADWMTANGWSSAK